ncbi:MAG: hypothetical protein B7X41_14105, partial [Microbacterium sp. 14-71-5]
MRRNHGEPGSRKFDHAAHRRAVQLHRHERARGGRRGRGRRRDRPRRRGVPPHDDRRRPDLQH